MCDKEKVVTENRIQRENHNVVTRSKKKNLNIFDDKWFYKTKLQNFSHFKSYFLFRKHLIDMIKDPWIDIPREPNGEVIHNI